MWSMYSVCGIYICAYVWCGLCTACVCVLCVYSAHAVDILCICVNVVCVWEKLLPTSFLLTVEHREASLPADSFVPHLCVTDPCCPKGAPAGLCNWKEQTPRPQRLGLFFPQRPLRSGNSPVITVWAHTSALVLRLPENRVDCCVQRRNSLCLQRYLLPV